MMFSYQNTKKVLIFAIITISAIATIGLVATTANGADNVSDNLSTRSGENRYNELFGFDDAGGVPTSFNMVLGFDDAGGVPT